MAADVESSRRGSTEPDGTDLSGQRTLKPAIASPGYRFMDGA
ncbi:hypothetical protein [Candidatus Thiosymbion oneisti]|nr:hypothetical protein [Candidatus Thiosymbion oneisti]